MAHLVVHRDEVLLVDPGALLDPVILPVVEVPGGGVARQLPGQLHSLTGS